MDISISFPKQKKEVLEVQKATAKRQFRLSLEKTTVTVEITQQDAQDILDKIANCFAGAVPVKFPSQDKKVFLVVEREGGISLVVYDSRTLASAQRECTKEIIQLAKKK